MSSKEIVLVQRITKKQNKVDFAVIENSILGKKNKITLTRNDMKIRASKIIFNGLHGYGLDFYGHTILKEAGVPQKIIMEKIDENTILVFISYSTIDSNINELIAESINTRCLGIDMGKKNTFAIVNNFNADPILIKGTMMAKFYNEEPDKFLEYLKNAMRFLQEYISKNNIKVIYIGDMYKYKPYDIILNHVKRLKGVRVVVIDEANTSKASFLDKDILCGEGDFSGKRLSRSQYISKDGIVFSADINAAYNILVKGNPFALYNVNNPKLKTIDYNITEI